MDFSQYVFYPTLTPARLLQAGSTLVGNYYNGIDNNGVGASLAAIGAGPLVIDGINANVTDRVLLIDQSNPIQNGIYIVIKAGSPTSSWLIERTSDFQNAPQLRAGMSIAIGAGTHNAGAVYQLIEPLPNIIGINGIFFDNSDQQLNLGTAAFKAASDNTKPSVASVSGITVATHIAQFADINGTVEDGGVLGTAAHKAATNNTQPFVASVLGATTIGQFAQFADTSGTIQNGTIGTAATKNATDNTQPLVASVVGPFFAGNNIVSNDNNGSIVDARNFTMMGLFPFAGGSTLITVGISGITTSSLAIITKLNSNFPSFIDSVAVSANLLTLNMNTDPGSSNFSYYIVTPRTP